MNLEQETKLEDQSETCRCDCACLKCSSAEPTKENIAIETKPVKTSTAGLKGAIVFLLLLIMPILMHSIFNLAFSTVLTGSMKPRWNPGDIMVTKQIKAIDAKVGEVIVLQNPETYDIYSHRVVAITQDKTNPNFLDFSTKGDANPTVDATIVKVNKLAMVPQGIGRIPWAGRVLVNFTDHKGKFITDLVVLLALGLIGSMLLKNAWKRPKKKKNDS